jgi:ATP-dependent RNA helicase DeaD
MEETSDFRTLGLSEASLNAIAEKGFEEPSAIQKKIIPLFLSGERDIIGQAQTGTGKTAAFGLPLVDLIPPLSGGPSGIILAPTRELALQISEEIRSFLGLRRVRVVAVYGGQALGPQIKLLRDGAEIVVGTPGRVIDLLERGCLDLGKARYFVLDEADEMLDMGFAEDVEKIL